MRNQYVGDIGDFGKYGLLRALCGLRKDSAGDRLRLGIVWYFVPDGGTTYVKDAHRFATCDPQLFDVLARVVESETRNIATIRTTDIFPDGTVFFEHPVPADLPSRIAWRERAAQGTSPCQVVFLDPDNGLKSSSSKLAFGRISRKHVYYEELERFLSDGTSLVVYHHLPRQDTDQHVKRHCGELRRALAVPEIWALLSHRYSPRAYFIVPNGREAVLRPRIDAFVSGPWGRPLHGKAHFERVA